MSEIDLISLEVDKLAHAQSVAVHAEDDRAVACPMPSDFASLLHQRFHFSWGQVFPSANGCIIGASWRNLALFALPGAFAPPCDINDLPHRIALHCVQNSPIAQRQYERQGRFAMESEEPQECRV